jgi:hypothetical protein
MTWYDVGGAFDEACPAESTRYNTASPPNGGVNDCEDDPAGIGVEVVVAPVDGLNHSTLSVRELDIAERFTVNVPPLGA